MTSKQRAYLMKLAQTEDAIFRFGKGEVTPEYITAIDEALAKEWNDLSPTHINARYLSEALLGDELEILWGSSNKKFYILCRSRRSEHFKLEIFLS